VSEYSRFGGLPSFFLTSHKAESEQKNRPRRRNSREDPTILGQVRKDFLKSRFPDRNSRVFVVATEAFIGS
jgi:hypothetical protein